MINLIIIYHLFQSALIRYFFHKYIVTHNAINNKIFLIINFQSNFKEYFSFLSTYKLHHQVYKEPNQNVNHAHRILSNFINIYAEIIINIHEIHVI